MKNQIKALVITLCIALCIAFCINIIQPQSKTKIAAVQGITKTQSQSQIVYMERLFNWIPDVIQYDVEIFQRNYNIDITAEETWRLKRGTCLGMSLLFKKYCNEVGIICETFTFQIKHVDIKGFDLHCINKVYINNEWFYVDIVFGNIELNENNGVYTALRTHKKSYFLFSQSSFERLYK